MLPEQRKVFSHEIGINLCPSMMVLRGRGKQRRQARKRKEPPPPAEPPPQSNGLPPGFCYLKDLLNRPLPVAPKKRKRAPATRPQPPDPVFRSAPLPVWPEEQMLLQRRRLAQAMTLFEQEELQLLHILLAQEERQALIEGWFERASVKVGNKLAEGRKVEVEKLGAEAAVLLEEGARLALLRYKLLEGEWRASRGVRRYPFAWPLVVVGAPLPWHSSFLLGRQFCRHNLFTPHPVLRRLQHLFEQRFASTLFVPAERLNADAPLTPQQLEARVDALCAETRLLIQQQWLPSSADVLSDHRAEWSYLAPSRRGESLRQVERFFGCVASLMSRQLRLLTLQSLKHLTEVFRFYKEGNIFTPPYEDLAMLKPSLLLLHLESADGKVVQKPSTEDVLAIARRCMLRVLKTSEELPRLEQVLLGSTENRFLSCVSENDEEAARLMTLAIGAVKENLSGPQIYLELYAPYLNLLDGDAETQLADFKEQSPSLKEWARYIEQLLGSKDAVTALRKQVQLNMVALECAPLNNLLIDRLEALRHNVLDYHITSSRTHNRRICNEFDEMSDRAAVLPEDTAGLVALTQYLTHCQDVRMLELRKMIRIAAANLNFLVTHAIFPGEDVQLNARVFLWPRDMEAVFGISRQRLAHRREVVEAALRERKAAFEAGLAQHQQHLNDLTRKDPAILTMDEMRDSVNCVNTLAAALHRDRAVAESINEEESLLNWLPAPFSELHQMMKAVSPFQLLWTTVLDFHQNYDNWYFGTFKDLDAQEVETRARKMHASLSEAAVSLAKVPGSKRIAELTRSKLDQFISLLPLLHCVCTPGLCARHWEQMSAAAGVELKAEEVTTLAQVVEFGLMEHVVLFQEVSECARREMALHKRLLEMKDEWIDIVLPSAPYRDAGVSVLGPLEHIQLMLDDHILRAQTMHSSPYVKAFEDEMQAWEEKLISMQDIIDAWLTCQALWLYLAPIFSSDDIMRQMPTEGANFARVDQNWRGIMENTDKDPHILKATDMPDMLPTLRDCNLTLENIQKGLNEYLEKKRNIFPRFYFLSNDELLEVLSETKDPCLVRVDKCFEGVTRIQLGVEGEVTSVVSPEGEELVLSGRLVPAEAKGNVEKWLVQLEDAIGRSLKDTCREAIAAFQRQPRHQWVLQWPAQAVGVAAAIHWTTDAAAAIRNNELGPFLEKCDEQIQKLWEVCREEHPLKTRRTLHNQLQTDLHNLKTLREFPEGEGVQGYAWNSCLRHYWRDDTVVVSLAACDIHYGFEYLGCPSRLPLIPSTASSIRAMVVAMRAGLGVCAVGPAAVGKTESCREAARIVARPFIVLSCSENLALPEVLKFLKGTVKSGGWLCLEEVERLREQLISALTHHMRQLGVASGSPVKGNVTCAVLATSTKNIPRTLVAQFRPVALQPPDDALVAQFMLKSRGFVNDQKLSEKLARVFTLLRDLLPEEQHYDLTPRSVNVVIQSVADKFDFTQDAAFEDRLLQKAIEAHLGPRISANDLAMYESVMIEVLGDAEKQSLVSDVLTAELESRNLMPSKNCINKLLQLKEALENRPAVILLGLTLSGKSTCYQVLASAMPKLTDGKTSVTFKTINPKSLTLGRLLGQFEDGSGEWLDGVLSSGFREFSNSSTVSEQKWLILDGPIESYWADNLNTALDNSRILCLSSGEMIKRGEHIRILFETSNLIQSSPSLIGRCAVINFESRQGAWQAMKDALVQITLRQKLTMDEQWELISELIEWLLPPLINLTLTLDAMLNTIDLLLFNGFTKLYTGMLGGETLFSSLWLQNALIFSLVWGLGSILTENGRSAFDTYFRTLIDGDNKMFPRPKSFKLTPQQLIPEKGLVFDWFLDKKNNGTWLPWTDSLSKGPSQSQVVGTAGVAMQRHFTLTSMSSGIPLLVLGPRGCGKSCASLDLLAALSPDEHLTNVCVLSGGTSAEQLQQTVVGRLDRRRKGVFGPPMGRKCVLLVDGIADHQGPAELLRQWLANGHWYNTDNTKVELVDVVLLATCNNTRQIPPRLFGQLLVIGLADLSETTLEKIFTVKLVDNHLAKGFASNVCRLGKGIVSASMDVYKKSKTLSTFYPTTSKQLFNLADALTILPSTHVSEPDKFSRFWIHEAHRVFVDLLQNSTDKQKLYEVIRASCSKHLGKPLELLVKKLLSEGESQIEMKHVGRLNFGNFMEPDANPKIYDELGDELALREKIMFYMRDKLHEQGTSLVMTKYLLQHTTRVARAVQWPLQGHAFLVGHPGCGRKTVAKIGAVVAGHNIFQVNPRGVHTLNDWKEDLKKVLRLCGPDDKSTALIIREDILHEIERLEDLSQVVLTGEIATLWDPDELLEIQEGMNLLAKLKGKKMDGSSSALYKYFVERVKSNLHVILIMSPDGKLFRETLKAFPQLLDNCTVDYFESWDDETMTAISEHFVALTQIEGEGEAAKCAAACCRFQKAAPPGPSATFLRLLRCFVKLHGASSYAISTQRGRYISGLQKLEQAATQVIEMRAKLQHLRPQLLETSEETLKLMIKIEQDTVEVEARKEIVGSDEAKANEAAAAAQAIKDDCESDLAEAVPALEAALTALDTLKPSDITLVKSMKNPPTGIKLVLEAICVMKGVKPDRKPHASGSGKMIEDFWAPSLRLIGEIKFLESLKTYEKDDIPPVIMGRIREKYVHDREFRPEIVRKSSTACEGLCKWVRAIEVYDRVIKIVSPKKEKLAEAEAALAFQMATLNEKRMQLQQVSDKLQTLNDDFAAMSKKKKDLEDNIDLCSQKLERAEKLIGGLGGERSRWGDLAAALEGRLDNVTGDVLLAAATVTYLGHLAPAGREEVLENWSAQLDELALAHSKPFSLIACLGDPVKIREWHMGGLSEDTFAVESALTTLNCDAWPLLYDPQAQGVEWVTSMEKELLLTNTSHPDFALKVEKAVTEGIPILVHLHQPIIPKLLGPVLSKPYLSEVNCRPKILLGDSLVEVAEQFRLYLCLSTGGVLSADDLATVTAVDLAVQDHGLEHRLLALVVEREQPPLEAARHELAVESASNRVQLQTIEQKILDVLSDTETNILEDETGLQVLTASKALSEDISRKQAISTVKEIEIDAARRKYLPVARNATELYFSLSSLSTLHPLYQYSFMWFTQTFSKALNSVEADSDASLEERLEALTASLTKNIFEIVSPGLFEKERHILALILWLAQLRAKGLYDESAWKAFLSGENLSSVKGLEAICDCLEDESWKDFKTKLDVEGIPAPFEDKTGLARIAIFRILRPHDVMPEIRRLVSYELGGSFARPPAADYGEALSLAGNKQPVVVGIGSDGDPVYSILREAGDGAQVHMVSLGEGQEAVAEAAILKAAVKGHFLLLHNCHLATEEWAATLERTTLKVFAAAHPNFRLVITFDSKGVTMPLIQKGVKVAAEQAGGLRSRVLHCFEDTKRLNSASKEQKTLLLALSLLHAVAQVRQLSQFSFSEQDFELSVSLAKQVDEWGVAGVQRALSECVYCARASDKSRRATLLALTEFYVCPEVLQDDAVRIARLVTPELDRIEDDLAPHAVHLSPSVRWDQGRLQTHQIVAALKNLFKWKESSDEANTEIEQQMPQLKQLKLDKKVTSASDKLYLILAQEVTRLNNELGSSSVPQLISDLEPRHAYLQKCLSGKTEIFCLDSVLRPQGLLRALAPRTREIFLCIAESNAFAPLFQGVILEGANLISDNLVEASDHARQILPHLKFVDSTEDNFAKKTGFHIECPLYHSRRCKLILATVVLRMTSNPVKWKLRSLACFLK